MLQVGVSFRSRLFLAAVTLLLPGAAIALATRAIPISPGESDRVVEAANACPTFHWAAAEGASGYELVVLDLAQPHEPTVALRHAIAGSAFGWTPDRAACLSPGGRYAWTVRALDAKGAPLGGGEGWATPRRFTVPALPDEAEVAAALDVLRRWEAGRVTSSGNSHGTWPGDSSARERSEHDLASKAVEASGTAAIRGENPATGADQHGVWGQSASSSGGGLVGVNTAGGPDLVLDGAAQGQADAHLTESGLDVSSASDSTFWMGNSGGGGFELNVVGGKIRAGTFIGGDFSGDGSGLANVPVGAHAHAGADISSGTVAEPRIAPELARDNEVFGIVLANDGPGSGLDADTLDGAQATTFQVRVLGTCPLGQTLQGINADGSVVCFDNPIPPRLSTVDSTGTLGVYISLALGTDGFPVISYNEENSRNLKVVKCNDAACAPGGETISIVDSAGDVGTDNSLAIGTDGFPVISYFDDTNDDLKVVKCNDPACAPGGETFTTVDGGGDVGWYTSLAIGTDGFPVISYRDNTNQDLKVVKCNDPACAPGGETITTVDSAGNVGWMSSLAIGTDGFPVISYRDVTNEDLKVVKCDDAACAPGGETITTVDSAGEVGWDTSVAIGTDGFPVISYYDHTNQDLKVVKCNDTACAPGGEIITAVDSVEAVGRYTSLSIGSDGFPVISYSDAYVWGGDLRVVKCNDIACAPGGEILTTIDSAGMVGAFTSLAIGTDSVPVISYGDQTNFDLKVARCSNASCRF